MGIITVEGLGQVEVAGDAPTPEEARTIMRAIQALQRGPTPQPDEPITPVATPAIEEALSPLAGLEERFRQMEDPRRKRGALEQAGRGLVASGVDLVRGEFLEGAAGAMEAAAGAEIGEGIKPERLFGGGPASTLVELMRPRFRGAAEDLSTFEEDTYTPSEPVPGEAWSAVLDDPTRLGRFVLEGVAGSAPHFVATLAGPVRYAAALVGDIAKGRARERGDNKITGADIGVAIPAAAAISGLNRAAQKLGWDNAATHGLLRTGINSAAAELPTEIAQDIVETTARQAYARPGGVSMEDIKQGAIGAATVAAPMGFLGGAGGRAIKRAGRAIEAPAVDQEARVMREAQRALAKAEEEAPAPEVAVTEEVVTPAEEVVAETVLEVAPGAEPEGEPALDEPVIEAVVEGPEVRADRVPGYYTQVAPPQLPVEAGPDVSAVDIQMEKDALAASIKETRKAVEAAAAEREVAPRPSGAKLRAVVDKGAKRRRVEEIESPAEPLSAKDALRRLALIADAATATEADVADAINDYVVAAEGAEGRVSAPRNIDNVERLKQVAAEMGRTEEEIDALLSHQRVSYAQVIDTMDAAGMRTTLTPDGMGVVIPGPTADAIARVNDGAYTPSAVDTAAIHSTYRSILRARENILTAASDPGVGKAALADLNKEDAKLRVQELEALLAQKRGGTPLGRALRFRQYLIDDVMNMVQAQARAVMKKRKPLTPDEVARIEKLWDAAENAEVEAVSTEKAAKKALGKAVKRLKSAELALKGAERVKKDAIKKARKPRKKVPRQEAAKLEAADKPIRVSPIRKSAEQKQLEKEFKAAQKAAGKAGDSVQKAKAAVRKAKRAKAEVPDRAIHPYLAAYRKAFGGALVLNSSGDNSALGRQALGLAIQNPRAAIQTLPIAWRAAPWSAGHRAYARDVQAEMLASPLQRLRDAAGLQMTEVEGLSNVEGGPMEAREEQWMFRALETGFFGDMLVVPSQNVFGLTLNKLRTATFDEGAQMLADLHGLDVNTMAAADLRKAPEGSRGRQFMEDLKGLGLLINVSSGRGTWTGASLGVARHLMFAPRYTMSRFELPVRALQLVAGRGAFEDVSPKARALFMKRTGRQLSWAMGVLLMSAISAAHNDEDVMGAVDAFFDPENPDFLKMRIGDYHIDLMQGLGPTWRYVWPFAFSPARATTEGAWPVTAREQYLRPFGQLVRNKLAPLVSGIVSIGPLEPFGGPGGYDYRGREISALARDERAGYGIQDAAGSPFVRGSSAEAAMATLLDRVIFPAAGMVAPITVQSAASAWLESATDDEKEKLQLLAPVALDFFGIGTAHYKDRKKKSKKAGRLGRYGTKGSGRYSW